MFFFASGPARAVVAGQLYLTRSTHDIPELAEFIRANMCSMALANAQMVDDLSIINHHTRRAFRDYPHITEEHILECCTKAMNLRD